MKSGSDLRTISYHKLVTWFWLLWKTTIFWFLILFEIFIRRENTTASSLKEKSTLDRDRLITDVSAEVDHLVSGSIFKDCINQIFQDSIHLPFNRMRKNVEFALHPQHETSYDFGIQLTKDFNYIKTKSRKRLRSLCWVRFAASTWNASWLWSTNNKGLQLF